MAGKWIDRNSRNTVRAAKQFNIGVRRFGCRCSWRGRRRRSRCGRRQRIVREILPPGKRSDGQTGDRINVYNWDLRNLQRRIGRCGLSCATQPIKLFAIGFGESATASRVYDPLLSHTRSVQSNVWVAILDGATCTQGAIYGPTGSSFQPSVAGQSELVGRRVLGRQICFFIVVDGRSHYTIRNFIGFNDDGVDGLVDAARDQICLVGDSQNE